MLKSKNLIYHSIAFICCLFLFSFDSLAQDFNNKRVFFKVKHSQKNLTASKSTRSINLVQNTPTWSKNQLFKFIRTEDTNENAYYIKCVENKKFLEVMVTNNNVWLRKKGKHASQKWQVIKKDKGYYQLRSKANDLYLSITSQGSKNNAAVAKLKEKPNYLFRIINEKDRPAVALNTLKLSDGKGKELSIWKSSGSNQQISKTITDGQQVTGVGGVTCTARVTTVVSETSSQVDAFGYDKWYLGRVYNAKEVNEKGPSATESYVGRARLPYKVYSADASLTSIVNNPTDGSMVLPELDKYISKSKVGEKNRAKHALEVVDISSEKNFDFHFGANFDSPMLDIKTGLNYKSNNTTRRMMIKYSQEHFTLKATPQEWDENGDLIATNEFFTDGFTPSNELDNLGYVSSVTYGRMLLVIVESDEKDWTLDAFLSAEYDNGTMNIGAEVEAAYSEAEKNFSYKIFVIGGSSKNAVREIVGQDIPNDINELKTLTSNWISEEPEYSGSSVPIGFTVQQVYDLPPLRIEGEFQTTELDDCEPPAPTASCSANEYIYVECQAGIIVKYIHIEWTTPNGNKGEFRSEKNMTDGGAQGFKIPQCAENIVVTLKTKNNFKEVNLGNAFNNEKLCIKICLLYTSDAADE